MLKSKMYIYIYSSFNFKKINDFSGEGEATAAQYLSLADGNLESAITLLFEAGAGGAADSTEQRPIDLDDEPEVRPPILPTQEVLVPPDVTCSFPRSSNSIFDRFRDFAVETSKHNSESPIFKIHFFFL